MTGLSPFSLEKSEQFERSFKKLIKSYKSQSKKREFKELIAKSLKEMIINPYPTKARSEPLPSGLKLSNDWQFYKLVIVAAKGASGQIRIMYLVNEIDRIIKLLWIYNHQQFQKRPPDKEIREVIKDIFED
ncbi:MAG: type II toxin-antitoxin system RelE/ParE family toxin [Crocosphaera sp.]